MLRWAGLLLAGCVGAHPTCDSEAPHPAPSGAPGNVVVVVLDDIGVDRVGAYGVHPAPSPTPRLDALIDGGMRFDRAYASPSCSPTRASLLTGRHPSRHGIGTWIQPRQDEFSLPESELTWAEVARDAGWATAAVGKWHLVSFADQDARRDPQRQGFDHFRGLLGNPDMALVGDGQPRGYWHWERVDDGVRSYSDAYLTTAQADDALALSRELSPPWVMLVAFSAAHRPLHRPPAALAAEWGETEVAHYDAVVQALDTELGRLLDGLDPQTTILVIGDNGTPREAIRAPWDPAAGKETVTEGGIRVPLAVSGPGVPVPGVSDALVHAVDVFATVADWVGVDTRDLSAEVDGVSLVPFLSTPAAPGRKCLWVEQFAPNGPGVLAVDDRAVVDPTHKLVRRIGAFDALTRVGNDPSAERPATDADAGRALQDEMARYLRALR